MLVPDYESDPDPDEHEEKSSATHDEQPQEKEKIETLESKSNDNEIIDAGATTATETMVTTSFSDAWAETLETDKVKKALRTNRNAATSSETKEKSHPYAKQAPTRAYLKARQDHLALEENVNKTQVVNLAGPLSEQPGFYCSVCNVLLKSSDAFLDHVNGRQHQKALGISMRVERSTLDQVQAKLSQVKDAKINGHLDAVSRAENYDFGKRMQQVQEEEERAKKEKKLAKKNAKKQQGKETALNGNQQDNNSHDAILEMDEETREQMKAMGFDFSSFGGGNK